MARDPAGSRIAVAFRAPARLFVFDTESGKPVASHGLCGDSDDLYYDGPRRRLYVACGAGSVDVFDVRGAKLVRLSRVQTGSGARTALYSPAMDRLFLAARANNGKSSAAIEIFRPVS
ncbi:MAG: hypothetical protein GC155_10595 [Alphaproteobacteria bacterium]|nr:hypothetical protein [Alphaproteobacteria bacterium]